MKDGEYMANAISFYDTNALLELQTKILESNFVLSSVSLYELEHIKVSKNKDDEIKYRARKVIRILDDNQDKYTTVIPTTKTYKILDKFKVDSTPDNLIMACAYDFGQKNKIVFKSNDVCCKVIAKNIFGLEVSGVSVKNEEEYTGFKEVIMNDTEMAVFYSDLNKNKYNLLTNEYLIIKNSKGEIVDSRKWDGLEYVTLSHRQINSDFSGKIKPRNEHQILAFDLLQNKNETIKVITGKFGTGKDFLMISHALELIKQGKFEKILWVRNTIEVKNTKSIGFLPGSMTEKLLPFAMIMADHLGGKEGLDMYISQGKIEVEHLGFIRGRDYKNTIIMCSESENMTKEHVQLLIGRIGEGSSLWLNGDYKQTDSGIFESNNGLIETVNKLKGHEKFGFVKLQKTERSETAAMADLLD